VREREYEYKEQQVTLLGKKLELSICTVPGIN
jgi:hypothetical protein